MPSNTTKSKARQMANALDLAYADALRRVMRGFTIAYTFQSAPPAELSTHIAEEHGFSLSVDHKGQARSTSRPAAAAKVLGFAATSSEARRQEVTLPWSEYVPGDPQAAVGMYPVVEYTSFNFPTPGPWSWPSVHSASVVEVFRRDITPPPSGSYTDAMTLPPTAWSDWQWSRAEWGHPGCWVSMACNIRLDHGMVVVRAVLDMAQVPEQPIPDRYVVTQEWDNETTREDQHRTLMAAYQQASAIADQMSDDDPPVDLFALSDDACACLRVVTEDRDAARAGQVLNDALFPQGDMAIEVSAGRWADSLEVLVPIEVADDVRGVLVRGGWQIMEVATVAEGSAGRV